MDKKIIVITLVLMLLSAGLFLFGCQHDQIIFNRESQAANVIKKFSNQNTQTKKVPGMIILKDDSADSKININFGPKDINFDMPVRFK